jgi:hypothetical protein
MCCLIEVSDAAFVTQLNGAGVAAQRQQRAADDLGQEHLSHLAALAGN